MKKQLLIAAALVFGAFTLSSCGGDSNNDGKKTKFEEPAMTASAKKLTAFSSSEIESIELTESGNYSARVKRSLLTPKAEAKPFVKAAEDADDELVYVIGVYKVGADGTITLVDLGTLTITGSGSNVSFSLTTTGGTEVSGTATSAAVVGSDETTTNLCRDWKVIRTDFRYEEFDATGKAKTPVGAQFPNAKYKTANNLRDMGEWLLETHEVDIMEELAAKESIEKITFTQRGTFMIEFGSTEHFEGNWNWQNKTAGTFSYKWNDESMETNFDNGLGSVKFDGSYAVLTLQGDIEENSNGTTYKVQLKLTLQQK
ncbi:MAG: hypothetical protein ILA34_00955 [Bacteroidaceae bacterium]|nr:hypothetical protein [Bacteroidaceae bacterium]